jgi:hypothetical protein
MSGNAPPSVHDPLISDVDYKRELEIVSNEVFEATYIYHVMEEINDLALKDQNALIAMNEQPLFWQAHRAANQATLFMALGRIFDSDEKTNSIHRLVRITKANVQVFSKPALGARKMGAGPRPAWLDDYLQSAWEPQNAQDMKPLKDALRPHAKIFETVYRPIRHSVYGHRLVSDEEAGRALFPQTNREAVGRILDFLHDLVESLNQLYLNGTRPELGKRDFTDYNQRIRADARNVIRTLSAHVDADRRADPA